MKKIFLFVSPLIFLVACSSGGGDAQPEILGCMDDCALNYSAEATVDDESCVYSFLGTYSIDEYTVDGESIFNSALPLYCIDAAISFGVGTYGTSYIFSDGSNTEENGTFTNTMTSVTLYPNDGSAPTTFQITKINCLEFDGTGVIDGETHYIETNFVTVASISGCMDDCALNYNPMATVADVCLYSFLGTYTISEYKVDGTSLFSNVWENPLVAGAIAFGLSNDGSIGIYGTSSIYADGTESVSNGTFVNSATQLIFNPSDGSASELWNTTKINCLEFDGNSMIDGMFVEIELDYYSGKLDNLEKSPTNSKFDVTQFKRKK
jgi:hypothetical protein